MQPEEIIRSVKDIYTHNAFMQHCGIKVHSISCGKAEAYACASCFTLESLQSLPEGFNLVIDLTEFLLLRFDLYFFLRCFRKNFS